MSEPADAADRVALVVVAHPCHDSYTAACAQAALAGLRGAGYSVELIDLYTVGFVAAMSLDERRAYESEQPILDPQVESNAALVRRAELLVFVYPTWWSGLPAILKGWLDRVLVPGVAFTLDPVTNKVRPGLGHVRRIVGISTYGSRRGYVWAINDNGRRMLTRALRMSCGWRVRTTWLALYALDTASDEARRAHLALIETRMAAL